MGAVEGSPDRHGDSGSALTVAEARALARRNRAARAAMTQRLCTEEAVAAGGTGGDGRYDSDLRKAPAASCAGEIAGAGSLTYVTSDVQPELEAEVELLVAQVRRQAEHYLSEQSLRRAGDAVACALAASYRWPEQIAYYGAHALGTPANREPQIVEYYSAEKRLAAAAQQSVPIELLASFPRMAKHLDQLEDALQRTGHRTTVNRVELIAKAVASSTYLTVLPASMFLGPEGQKGQGEDRTRLARRRPYDRVTVERQKGGHKSKPRKSKPEKPPKREIQPGELSRGSNWGIVCNGRLAASGAPGKGVLERWKLLGADTVVTLLKDNEQGTTIKIARRCAELGLDWMHLPLTGKSALSDPNEDDRRSLAAAPEIAAKLRTGASIVVHCAAGMHRTGTICYLSMRHAGLEAEVAMDLLKKDEACDA